jgi:polyhydroxyalkanoate synthesis regulator phasin
MAKRRTSPQRLPDTVRDAVERTVQATIGQAQTTRERTQRSVDDLVRGAEVSAKSVRKAIDAGRPATHEEVRDLQKEIRALARRLDAIEEQLPAKRSTAKRSTAKRTSGSQPKRTTSSRAKKR